MKSEKQTFLSIMTDADILHAFETLISDYDRRTLRKWIDFFKKCMYYASSDYSNPMFLSLAYNEIKKSDQYPQEFLYIHKLMYQFLCLRTPCFLEFPTCTDSVSAYDPSVIKWNVPASVTPFLIAYIKAASKFKKDAPVTSFFHNLEETLTEIATRQNDSIEADCQNLTDEILCRRYFCTVEEIYNTFAKNNRQKETIRHCIFHLTETLTAFS